MHKQSAYLAVLFLACTRASPFLP